MPGTIGGTGLALLWPDDDVTLSHCGRHVLLKAGDLAIVDRALPIEVGGAQGWSARLLDLSDRRIVARIGEGTQGIAVALDGVASFGILLKRLWTVADEAIAFGIDDVIIDARFIDLVNDLGGRLLAQVTGGRLPSQTLATIDRARTLIAANLADAAFGVAPLAAMMRVSPRYLSSLFAQAGTTTSRTILDARLAAARRLLTDPVNACRQIASIAAACGFADQGHFTRRFREEEGVTPGQFRRENTKVTTRL